MSDIAPLETRCPACGAEHTCLVFSSLNGMLLPAEIEEILAGTFERTRCAACEHVWQPEHELLYVDMRAGHWIVMYPAQARRGYSRLERSVERLLAAEFSHAPAVVAPALAGVKARLVFGHTMLAEALRVLRAGLDPALVEAAKLLWIRKHLPEFLALGPCELVVHAIEGGSLHCQARRLPDLSPLTEVHIAPEILGEARATRSLIEQSHPDLFRKPYVSACRYLYGDPAQV